MREAWNAATMIEREACANECSTKICGSQGLLVLLAAYFLVVTVGGTTTEFLPQRQAHSALTPFEQGETNDFAEMKTGTRYVITKKAKTAHFRLAITFH